VLQGNTPGDPHTIPLRVLCSVHCVCSTNTTCNTNRRRQRPTWTKPRVCAYLSLACARHAPTCTCPSCAHARHLPARALPMPASACCLRVFAMLVFLAHTCEHVSAYGLLGGCAHVLLSMWVHAYFYCAIYNERWALISFGYICVPACHCICGYTLNIPPPHTLPYYPRTKHPPCPLSPVSSFPGHDHWGGTPPIDHGRAAAKPTIGARRRRLCLSLCSLLPALCFAKTSHPASHPHNTLACNHTSLPPPPRLHPCTP